VFDNLNSKSVIWTIPVMAPDACRYALQWRISPRAVGANPMPGSRVGAVPLAQRGALIARKPEGGKAEDKAGGRLEAGMKAMAKEDGASGARGGEAYPAEGEERESPSKTRSINSTKADRGHARHVLE
jgi:hypothetical protein